MIRKYIPVLFLFIYLQSFGQAPTNNPAAPQADATPPPKLVVGIVVDQMRYDYLDRFWKKYSDGGFKKLVNEGFLFTKANYNYVPTKTAPGHACIYTGTTPSVNGIVSNEWYDRKQKREVYCVEDTAVSPVGTTFDEGKMSPINLFAPTVTDALRMASFNQSKVIGISLKDRGSILPAGHFPTAAYWHDPNTNNWVTSSFYMKALPKWVSDFNAKNMVDTFLRKPWTTLLPINQYTESTADDNAYEGLFKGETKPVFPHNLPALRGKEKELLRKTPFGNTFTKLFVKAAVEAEQLGKGKSTDFLAVSFSSTDYVGHMYGTNAIELEDTYLRLDRDLADLLKFLDLKVGKGKYLVFLTADHGAPPNPLYSRDHGLPGGIFNSKAIADSLKGFLNKTYGEGDYIAYAHRQDIFLNRELINEKKIDLREIQVRCADFLKQVDGVAEVIPAEKLSENGAKAGIELFMYNGFYAERSPDLLIELKPGWIESSITTGTTHRTSYDYDTHVPLLFYGWKIAHGKSDREVVIPDIAPTISSLLNIPAPGRATGKPLEEVLK